MLEVNFTPFPVLNTDRLLLRHITTADADEILRMRSDAVSLEFLDKEPLKNIDEALALINKIQSSLDNNDGITWGIALKDSPATLIGTIGLWTITKEHYRAEIGYMLLRAYFKKGYMTEAIKVVNDFGFNQMNLHSIEANINPANQASAATLIKTGFVQEAYFKENFYFNGVFKDSAIYSLLKK